MTVSHARCRARRRLARWSLLLAPAAGATRLAAHAASHHPHRRRAVTLAATWYEPSLAARAGGHPRSHAPPIAARLGSRSRHRLAAEGIGALAIDLRGHGESSGVVRPATLGYSAMVPRRRRPRGGISPAAADVLQSTRRHRRRVARRQPRGAARRPTIRPSPAVALLSPSLDYRGLRIEAAAMKKYGSRPVLLVASDDDPYAMRIGERAAEEPGGGRAKSLILEPCRPRHDHARPATRTSPRSLVDWFRQDVVMIGVLCAKESVIFGIAGMFFGAARRLDHRQPAGGAGRAGAAARPRRTPAAASRRRRRRRSTRRAPRPEGRPRSATRTTPSARAARQPVLRRRALRRRGAVVRGGAEDRAARTST